MQRYDLSSILREKLNLSAEFADSSTKQLFDCKNKIYLQAIECYAQSGHKTFLQKNRYNTESLMNDFGMDYLNAVLMLVWIEEEPDEAMSALDDGIDDII